MILAKGQLDHSYTFWIMPIYKFGPVYFISPHPLEVWQRGSPIEQDNWLNIVIKNEAMGYFAHTQNKNFGVIGFH